MECDAVENSTALLWQRLEKLKTADGADLNDEEIGIINCRNRKKCFDGAHKGKLHIPQMGDYARLMRAVPVEKGACSLIREALNIVSFFIELHS